MMKISNRLFCIYRQVPGLLLCLFLTGFVSLISYASGWTWIDCDGDGLEECYYFLDNGTYLKGTATPDGYIVTPEGQWTQNGVIQKKRPGEPYRAEENTVRAETPWSEAVSITQLADVYQFTRYCTLGAEIPYDFRTFQGLGRPFVVVVQGNELSLANDTAFSTYTGDGDHWQVNGNVLYFDQTHRLHWINSAYGQLMELIAEPIQHNE